VWCETLSEWWNDALSMTRILALAIFHNGKQLIDEALRHGGIL
jgi:hypothetical protein